ncbi:hypothetical protein ACWCOT_45400 [Nonomuraea bangladeshensis]
MRQAIKEGEDESTRTGTYIIWRTGEALREQGAAVELPSKATLYRLLAKLTQGTHALGTARARRSRAHGAKAPFGQWTVFAPGEVVQIDSTPLDVLVRLDDGVVGKRALSFLANISLRIDLQPLPKLTYKRCLILESGRSTLVVHGGDHLGQVPPDRRAGASTAMAAVHGQHWTRTEHGYGVRPGP